MGNYHSALCMQSIGETDPRRSVFVSGQPTSVLGNRPQEKNPSSGGVCTVGKLSSVDVPVTSTVLTELGIQEPTSVFKLCRGCRYVGSYSRTDFFPR